jgi:hypothetical protein
MSQKSSLLQLTRSVSRSLTPDNSFSNAETHADPEKNQHDVSEDVYSGHGEPRGEGEDLARREWKPRSIRARQNNLGFGTKG